ncbi:hypothetical protein [Winogradskyella sp. SYSU M77433]|uniref:hypothetical protein n=1 Tax=Winogradskyella sp. SYSU M77433 TaxID=3042722 RepID=UPI00248170CA|nr:hypothetical protein [Winogradskyella sp. SYSU M77433]MDH7911372.1 hypothetical protein [Winogradskyella sp. SYSU M77433]
MAQTIILANGKAYKRSAFGDVRYYSKGWVIGFELNNIYYTSLYSGKGTGEFTHFIRKDKYNEYKNIEAGEERTKKLSEHYLSESNLSQYQAVLGDTINVQIRKRITEGDGTHKLCKEVKSWSFTGKIYSTTAFSPELAPPEGVEVISTGLEDCLHLTDEARQIYNMAKNRIGNFSGDLLWDMAVVEDIVELLTKFEPDVTQALQNIGMINLYDEEMSLWDQEADLGYYYYTNQQLIEYRDYLKAFNKWYDDKRERFQNEDNVSKLYWLVFMLDEKVLVTIPYQDKISVLDKFLTENIHERYITDFNGPLREPMVLKLLRTINDSEASDFLEDLLERPSNTDFALGENLHNPIRLKALYKAIDDQRFTIFGNDNRKKFVELIIGLWKKSKYSFYDHSQSSDNDQNIDTTSYFNNEGLRYFIDDENPYWYIKNKDIEHLGEPVIEMGSFGTWYDDEDQLVNLGPLTFNFRQHYKSGKDEDFVNEIITIHQDRGYTPVYGDAVFDGIEFLPPFFGDTNNKLKYHVYQPIKFIQYEDDGNRILSFETVPALAFFYEQEYEKLKELDATIVLAAELSLEVLFFAISGGASSLAQIRHLRYATKLGRGISGTGNAVKLWRGAEVALEALSFSTGTISSTFNYLASTTTIGTPEYEKYKDLRMFFGLLALTSGVSSIGARSLAIKKARKLVNDMDVDGVVYNIDPELDNIIRTIGNSDIFITQMRSYLTFLESNHSLANLVNRFDALSELKKLSFYDDFNDLKNIDSWNKISNSPEAFNNWVALKNVEYQDTKLVGVITNQNRTDGFIRYYNEDVSKTILSRNFSQTERIAFIDEFADAEDAIFNNFNNNPYGIELGMQGIFPVATSGDVLKLDEIKDILRTTFAANEFDVLGFIAMKNSIKWSDVEPSFLNVIDDFVPMSKTELTSFRNEFSQYVVSNPELKNLFFKSNRLRVITKRYQDDVLIDEIIELFISGDKAKVDPILDNFPPDIRNKFVEPLNEELYFDVFNRASMDISKGIARFDDTEVKYIYNYLINHIGSGNRVVMEIESVLYTCANCRKYIIALKKYAETQNVDLSIISRAHPRAFKNSDVNTIINE